MNHIFILLIFFVNSEVVFNQPVLSDNPPEQFKQMFYDSGKNWESLSIFGFNKTDSESKLQVTELGPNTLFKGFVDLQFGKDNFSLEGFGHIRYKNRFYAYTSALPFNSFPKDKSSYYANTSLLKKNRISGLGFKNDWAILQLGRGKESWGSGDNIQLALSDYSAVYDYFLLGSDYGKIRVRYIHGLLENVENNINRFITARGIEWTNKRSIIIGFSETVIYSGENRSMDIGYFNPISSHLEIELNERLNLIGNGNSNAVWQIHLEYLLKNNIRLSLNYLIDEFVIDKEIELEKENGDGFSIRLAYTPFISSNNILTCYSSLVFVGTPTFRHKNGTNNFVQNNKPLGWSGGSDGYDYRAGINYFNKKNLVVTLSSGFLQSGEESTLQRGYDPYYDYKSGKFPSGLVDNIHYIESAINFWWKKNFLFTSAIHLSKQKNLIDIKLSILVF